MSSRRVLKAAQAIREVVSMAIIADLKDPRIKDVTVTLVEVAPDMRQAKVHVSVMGDETKQGLCIRGLQSSAGYLQQKVGNRIDTRYTPRLQFVLDQGIQHALLVTRILEEVIPAERVQEGQAESNTGEPEASGSSDPSEAPIGVRAVDPTHETDRESPGESVEGPV
jgi:ribosome-binding factor A|tara:strand:- start:866 stop:1366 length:501 start_codon:yes stop_codon:yes gene_type:complete